MSITPSVLINAVTPRPDGTEVGSQFALNATAIPLALASTVGVTSVEWSIVAKPTGSTVAIANATPTTPFSTTFGPLDVTGTYILKCVLNGDAASVKEVAVAVLTPNLGFRKPARGETSQWSGDAWWGDDINAMIDQADSPSLAPGSIVNADINAAAAIAGSKIAADFTGQTVTGSSVTAVGTVTGGAVRSSGTYYLYAASKAVEGCINGDISTANATPTTAASRPKVNDTVMEFNATAIAIKSDGTAHWRQTVQATFRVDGAGVITEMGTNELGTEKTNGTTTAMAVALVASGSNIIAQVTGRAAEDWRWIVSLGFLYRTTAA